MKQRVLVLFVSLVGCDVAPTPQAEATQPARADAAAPEGIVLYAVQRSLQPGRYYESAWFLVEGNEVVPRDRNYAHDLTNHNTPRIPTSILARYFPKLNAGALSQLSDAFANAPIEMVNTTYPLAKGEAAHSITVGKLTVITVVIDADLKCWQDRACVYTQAAIAKGVGQLAGGKHEGVAPWVPAKASCFNRDVRLYVRCQVANQNVRPSPASKTCGELGDADPACLLLNWLCIGDTRVACIADGKPDPA
jgi:hypothetical protein